MDFQTPWNRFDLPVEAGGGGTKTSQSFVPAALQIRMMIEAGKRLDLSRRELFDQVEDEEAELEPVALRAPGGDLVDQQAEVRELEAQIAELRRRLEAPAVVAPVVAPPAPPAAPGPAK